MGYCLLIVRDVFYREYHTGWTVASKLGFRFVVTGLEESFLPAQPHVLLHGSCLQGFRECPHSERELFFAAKFARYHIQSQLDVRYSPIRYPRKQVLPRARGGPTCLALQTLAGGLDAD